MPPRKKGELTPMGNIISESMETGFLGLTREMIRVFEVWEEAVGEYNASRTRPESIKNGRLTVLVEAPAWIDHFSYLKAQFIDRINQTLDAPVVEDILFKVAAPPRSDQTRKAPPAAPGRSGPPPSSSPNQMEKILDNIESPQLRENLASFLTRSKTGG